MQRIKKISRNTAAVIASKLAGSGLTLFLVIAINRKLGPASAGIYSFALAVYMIFSVLPDFGISSVFVRDVAADPSRVPAYIRNIAVVRLLLGLAALVLLVLMNLGSYLVAPGIDGATKFWTVSVIGLSLLVEQPLANTLTEAFMGLEKLGQVALAYLNITVIKVVLSLYILLRGVSQPLPLLMGVYILSQTYA
ncbi:MAG: lipopolysaccharide biosynthesis protein, partial [Candidatus Geothermincolia bacterium]